MRRKRVDPLRVHVLTAAVFSVVAGSLLVIWTFPKFFALLLLLAVSAIGYAKLYEFIESRLEAEEGRLAKDLGLDRDLDEDLDDALEAPPRPKPARRKRKAKAAAPAPPTPTPAAPEAPLATEVPPTGASSN